ncbi:MAG: cobalamin-independent methionine synthase II family protein [Gammaproteobacteria bacterium]|jgi:5-methyltetrahydropteroyltriglutamate--homocysteine methyltransferase|nr:cobalamin-independent methionine synthase II family protein [Gammaproteobacteria bacterium]MDP6615679.1 cobalamin-independent methionine synthase II family protein [Gammaproteobacteria bacterium]MDP6694706.1 cobalamin-independent methionine synthase II family protein [Gammaproteobacteria bacterium]MDP7041709.1 cobalamin-independent methionine synthase II family protein [Gammaproteobacteria bacterium]
MKKVLTTHVGSLPRPEILLKLMQARDDGEAVDESRLANELRTAVADVVAKQVEIGVDIVSDGEMSKPGYVSYVNERLEGFGSSWEGHIAQDLRDYRNLAIHLVKTGLVIPTGGGPCCIGPVAVRDTTALEADLANFAAALGKSGHKDAFMNSASPGVVAVFQKNEYYPSEDAYIEAVAEALRSEYEAIVTAGFALQLDSPDLAMGRHLACADMSDDEFLVVVRRNVAALNEATRNIPSDRLRMHVCWGNYPGPHHHDIPLTKILPAVLEARPRYLLLEGANPRHAHEYDLFGAIELPEDKVLVPGVIDSTSNYIEHPDLVAQRICNYADIVGRDRVMAGSDCGFSTFRGLPTVYPDITWEKLKSLVEGAKRATERLY